jgi:hypothetical protein
MKSQVSVEFLVSVAVLLIIYGVTLSVYNLYFKVPVLETEAGRQVCYTALNGIDAAVMGGDGFATNVSLPLKIDSNEYFVFITNRSIITVDWNKSEFVCSITTQAVSDTWFKPCRFSVLNLNGTVYLGTVSTDKTEYLAGETVIINGSYYIGNITLTIRHENNTLVGGYPINITTTNNMFSHNWNSTPRGRFKIYVQDSLYKNLNSERDIEIL